MEEDIRLCRLSELSFQASVELWNEGFAGYFADMTRTLFNHLKYLGTTNIHPEQSVVAVVAGKPAGFVLTALRTVGGRKLAWNGGTAIVPKHRGIGVGKAMMNEAIRIYRELDVDTAYLEAITANDAAVALYAGRGYGIRGRLLILSLPQEPKRLPFFLERDHEVGRAAAAYKLLRVPPREVGQLAFYRDSAPWCSQWPNIADGEAVIVIDGQNAVAGFALYKRSFDEDGKPKGVHVLQAEIDGSRTDIREAASFLLAELYGPGDAAIRRTADNIPETSPIAQLLIEAGFETVFSQYLMALELKS